MKKADWAKAEVVIRATAELTSWGSSSYRHGALLVRRVAYKSESYTSYDDLLEVTFQANNLTERNDFLLHEVQRLQALPIEWFQRLDTAPRPYGGFYGVRLGTMQWSDLQRAADVAKDLMAAMRKGKDTGCALWDMVQGCLACGVKPENVTWPEGKSTGTVRKWLGSSLALELIARDADRRAKEAKEREEFQASPALAVVGEEDQA